jgi:hypothetical protein
MAEQEDMTIPKSDILTEEQVEEAIADEPKEEEVPELPSEKEDESLLAGKFKTQEDLLKAYQELEKKLGSQGKEEGESPEDSAKEAPEVDEEYLEWKVAKQQDELLQPVGGLETYKQAIDWAATNLPKEDVDAYNAAVDKAGGDKEVIRVLATFLVDKYKASVSNTPKPEVDPIHSGEGNKPKPSKGYDTKSDMLKDIQDPRYARDPSYRKAVEKKIAATDESSWYSDLPRY